MSAKILAHGILTSANPISDVKINSLELVTVYAWGTFDGATVKLQDMPPEINPDGSVNSEWFDSGSDVNGTSKFHGNVKLAASTRIRLFSESGGGSQSVNYVIVG